MTAMSVYFRRRYVEIRPRNVSPMALSAGFTVLAGAVGRGVEPSGAANVGGLPLCAGDRRIHRIGLMRLWVCESRAVVRSDRSD